MTSLPFRSATELVDLVKKKKISAEELLDLYLGRVSSTETRASTPSSRTDIPRRATSRKGRGPPRLCQGRRPRAASPVCR